MVSYRYLQPNRIFAMQIGCGYLFNSSSRAFSIGDKSTRPFPGNRADFTRVTGDVFGDFFSIGFGDTLRDEIFMKLRSYSA